MRIGRSPVKPAPNATNNAKQRPLPTVSVPLSDASSAVAAAGFGPQPNLAPARPKEKAVIDLTDEDDAAAAAAAAAAAGVDVGARLRQAPGGAVKRNMPSAPGAAARPVAGSVVRVSPMNMPRANAISRQIVSNNATGNRKMSSSLFSLVLNLSLSLLRPAQFVGQCHHADPFGEHATGWIAPTSTASRTLAASAATKVSSRMEAAAIASRHSHQPTRFRHCHLVDPGGHGLAIRRVCNLPDLCLSGDHQ